MRKTVRVAQNSGFCFGVASAAKAVENEVKNKLPGERIFTLGKLIHNNIYNDRLKSQGVGIASESELEDLARSACANSPVKVFVRAHGIPASTEDKLLRLSFQNPYFSFVDCTCPFVKKIHKILAENSSDDAMLFVLGSADHPEVQGFCSKFCGQKFIFSKASELEDMFENGKMNSDCAKQPIAVAQTTQNLGEWEKTKKLLKKVYAKPLIYDTICSVTEKRQTEAKTLSAQSDFMIVIGSKSSSNSVKLYDICRAECENTVMVETAEEVIPYKNLDYVKIGIAAGASTPSDIIQEVQNTMSEAIENFAELLEDSLKTLNTGDTVTGYVTAVNDGEIQLDIGAKVTGIIKADQITDDPSVKLSEMFKIGDAVDAFVIRVSDVEGFATLSKKRVDSDRCWSKIVAAKENDEILEGTVIEVVKGGIIVLHDATRIFIHESQTGLPKDADLHTMIGQTVSFKLTEVRDYGKKAKGSIRVVLREEKRAADAAFWASIEEGKQYTGKVKSLTAYGAFVDLGGVDGMVHATELSWKRVKPSDVVSVGDEITVFVKSFDAEKKRISLGYKTEETNPWYIFKSNFAVGDIAQVKIVSMMPFGAFAEIVDGVDGLIHISQISMTKIAKPADVLENGQIVDAKIVEIDDEKQKVSLSIRALLEEAKAAAEAMPEEAVEEAVEAVEEAVEAVEEAVEAVEATEEAVADAE
ncbi:MAG: 4-hydroxy-3-methylbut-2-enyl diphosphate reductase [Ruminococcaceae bacterium]|nr:4-hydroxy-3-methylbut-2-enyl diphosphate reductase [Oscillospiraceae bacterium]